MRAFEDAYRTFTIYSPRAPAGTRGSFEGLLTGLDAFAVMPNMNATSNDQTASAIIEVDLAENGGYLNVNNRDVVTDVVTGLAYAVTRIDSARGKLLLTVSQSGPNTATSPPQLPPT